MCLRTVEGGDYDQVSYRTVPGDDEFAARTVSGLGGGISLANTPPTMTEITGPASGTYITPTGCVYIDVYVCGAGGGGAGGDPAVAAQRYGSGGGGGDISFGIFEAGSYTYDLHAGGAGGVGFANGTAAAQFSTFDILKASGGNGGSKGASTNNSAGRWNGSLALKNSLINFGYSRGIPGGTSPAGGGQQLLNGYLGRASRNTANSTGRVGRSGGGGAGGTRGGDGGAGGPSVLLIVEYY